jgi:hypothetical protein
MAEIINMEQVLLTRHFEKKTGLKACIEEIVHLRLGGELVVTLYPKPREAYFTNEFIDTAHSDPRIKPLIDYLAKENYSINV